MIIDVSGKVRGQRAVCWERVGGVHPLNETGKAICTEPMANPNTDHLNEAKIYEAVSEWHKVT